MVEIGISFATIKSLLIFFAPIVLPRALNFYRNVRLAIARQPNPKPLPSNASRALNVLFCAILFFFLLSLPFNPYAPSPSIFSLTRSRINTPLDIIFSRLARHRAGGVLTPADQLLKSKLSSPAARRAYLRFGAETLTQCQFCTLDDIHTYLLYYLPFNALIPHLFHMVIVGLTTASPFAGREAARWRNKFTIAGLVLAAIDIYAIFTWDPVRTGPASVRDGITTPSTAFETMARLRPLAFAIFDGALAFFIYVSATNRFFFTPPTQADQVDQLVSASLASLSGASSKLHAASVTRNAVVRDKVLKARDDAYWRTVVAMDGESSRVNGGALPSSIWEESAVVRAMSRAMAGQGGVDLAQLGVSAAEYVNGMTAGLEHGQQEVQTVE
ncbi:hypothetical protein P175DRAFT_0504378 [Aspergillus ochraceoroseus IBT 24754]|uniref:Uncharacterized protein n=2 Tax=Aspergillus ochraceoroseus TaxID=138278 RepID=A0A2T5LMX8_9EURO|nr:uncharacterized protein P175DRAFT_0504378 [Aspergillus ochraceoroseus IBT 24754]KKK14236.1 hypothetical protein AOCH_007290 [Aspergillus ochraceoroseus]PTU17638.1 hypothetical protein P175DRAFT_0504378 [Aspergillus ochraceoroseus IBT 24754]